VSQPEGVNKRVMEELRAIASVPVFSHKQWEAQHEGVYLTRCEILPAHHPPDTVVQHLTVTLDHGPLRGDFVEDMLTIERIGWERFQTGVSYNWVIDMVTGQIAQGAYLDAQGSHTVNVKGVAGFSYNQNRMARAIAFMGMPKDKVSKLAVESAADVLTAMFRGGAITRTPDYLPHSHFAHKDCPCDPTRAKMDEIYRRFQKRITA
jgi:hypothetical protein